MGLFNMAKASEETIRKRKEYYQRTKEAHFARAAEGRLRTRAKWKEFRSTLACTKCGENHPATLDFHHVIKDNKRSVSTLIRNNAFKAAMKEIEEKCIVLCSNCHRKLHDEERNNPDR